jgi:hypothetical protein
VIAHVDHGKSSLCDCLLTKAGQLNERALGSCELDSLAEERERGITIVASAVALRYALPHALLTEARRLALLRMAEQRLAPLAPRAASELDDDGTSSVRLYVGNVPRDATETQIIGIFNTYLLSIDYKDVWLKFTKLVADALRGVVPSLPESLELCFRKNGSATLTLPGSEYVADAQRLLTTTIVVDGRQLQLEPMRHRAERDATTQLVCSILC